MDFGFMGTSLALITAMLSDVTSETDYLKMIKLRLLVNSIACTS